MHPAFLAMLIAVLFIGLSELFFSKFHKNPSLYLVLGIILIFLSTNETRNDFLKSCFTRQDFRRIRWIENGLLSLPFSFFLSYQGHFSLALAFLFLSFVLTFIPLKRKYNFTLPTPFSRYPFEFTRGFRYFFILHGLTYFFTYMAIAYSNFNMGILILLVSFLVNAIYFSFQENTLDVWVFHHTTKQFLLLKAKTIIRYGAVSSFPIIVALFFFFSANFTWTLLVILIGFHYIFLFLVMKYTFLPSKPSFADELIQLFCLFFPPAMLVAIPYYSIQSMKNLREILHD